MKQVFWALAVASIGLFAVQAQAADTVTAIALTRKNACMGCHAVSRKLVGPSYQAIAEKYKGDPDAVPKLTNKVLKGGAGVWGMIPMPSHPGMSTADAQTVVEWVLAGAPEK